MVGVDSSEKAAKDFFADHKMEFKMDAINMAPRGAFIFSVTVFSLEAHLIFQLIRQ